MSWAVFSTNMAVKSAQCVETESYGKIVVSGTFLKRLKALEMGHLNGPVPLDLFVEKGLYKSEAKKISERSGDPEDEIEQRLRNEIKSNGSSNFISWNEAAPGLKEISIAPLPRMIGSVMLFIWVLMLVFQGEGLELDTLRRKHPILIFLSLLVGKIFPVLVRFINPFLVLSWPWLFLFLGGKSDGSFSFTHGVLTCLACPAIIITEATWFSVWEAQKGLGGNNSSTDSSPSRLKKRTIHFGKEPLYKKEFLWFTRDRGAIVQAILMRFPETAELLEKSQAQFAKNINARYIYAFIAITIAPFAEEYLFRGLLYRALDREWGGWRAIIGSAAFFTIYHPPVSWIPVFLVGVICAMLFIVML
ncbi:MAG: CPBP family intramembrane metalloprotease [Deltaproteobacteria bacterium]|nr:CPBP family intramembrane metalloprotease [Deltaproteobacteria bacterium]